MRDKQNCLIICQWLGERGRKWGSELVLMGCIINMEMVVAYAFVIGKISPLPLNLVNKSVSRGTILFAMLHYREIVCCLPSFIGQFYRCSP